MPVSWIWWVLIGRGLFWGGGVWCIGARSAENGLGLVTCGVGGFGVVISPLILNERGNAGVFAKIPTILLLCSEITKSTGNIFHCRKTSKKLLRMFENATNVAGSIALFLSNVDYFFDQRSGAHHMNAG